MTFERYIEKGGRRLRLGYTTGSCAALAAKAATRMLLAGRPVSRSSITTPAGVVIEVEVENAGLSPTAASCAVRKDAGDDPDVTDGALVHAEARRNDDGIIVVDGGEGVGRVAKNGLGMALGEAAINAVPRKMIADAVDEARREAGYSGGVSVTISIPGGEELAKKTFNPRLGIIGGLSIIGTTGIVEPMSDKAMVDVVRAEMKVLAAEGAREIILTPGKRGAHFLARRPEFARFPHVLCSNFIGDGLDIAAATGFDLVILVGHIGKLVKVSGGVMDTHSRVADCRMELLALYAALERADPGTPEEVLAARTTGEALAVLGRNGLTDAVVRRMLARIDHYLALRADGRFSVGTVVFDDNYDILGVSPAAQSSLPPDAESKAKT